MDARVRTWAAVVWSRTYRGRTVLAIGVLGLAVAGCTSARSGARTPVAAAPPPQAVVVTPALERSVPVYQDAVAQTVALQTVELRPHVGGTIEQVLFKEGSEVRRGQTMFVIDQRPYQTALQSAEAQVATAQAQLVTAQAALKQALEETGLAQAQAQLAAVEAPLVNAQQQLKRDQYLLAQGAVAQQQIDNDTATEQAAQATVTAQEATVKNTALSQQISIAQARAGIQQAEAVIAQAEAGVAQGKLNLLYTTVNAPIDGVVGLLSVDDGNLVAANQLLATMSSVDPMVVQFSVSELTFLELEKRAIATAASTGKPAANIASFELILADGSNYPQSGTFRTLDRAVDPTSGTITLQALFPNPDRLLKPGMYARVRARTEERPNAVLIPQSAVLQIQGTNTVFVVANDNTVSVRTISEGGTYGPFFVVLSGLKPGERVIVEGLQKVQAGMTVTPTVQAPPPVPAESGRP